MLVSLSNVSCAVFLLAAKHQFNISSLGTKVPVSVLLSYLFGLAAHLTFEGDTLTPGLLCFKGFLRMKIYLAGGIIENSDDWRCKIVKNLSTTDTTHVSKSMFNKTWTPVKNAISGCFDYVGPFQDSDNNFHLRQRAIDSADFVFAWVKESGYLFDLFSLSAELGYAAGKDKIVAVSTGIPDANDIENDFWWAIRDLPFFPYFNYHEDPMTAFIESIKTHLEFFPVTKRLKLYKNPKSHKFFDHDLSRCGHVYLIRSDRGEYKIGRTKNIPNRMKLFAVKLPFEFDIIHTIPCSDMFEAEKLLHKRFDNLRINGEWFNLDKKDVDLICSTHAYDKYGFYDRDATINSNFIAELYPESE